MQIQRDKRQISFDTILLQQPKRQHWKNVQIRILLLVQYNLESHKFIFLVRSNGLVGKRNQNHPILRFHSRQCKNYTFSNPYEAHLLSKCTLSRQLSVGYKILLNFMETVSLTAILFISSWKTITPQLNYPQSQGPIAQRKPSMERHSNKNFEKRIISKSAQKNGPKII